MVGQDRSCLGAMAGDGNADMCSDGQELEKSVAHRRRGQMQARCPDLVVDKAPLNSSTCVETGNASVFEMIERSRRDTEICLHGANSGSAASCGFFVQGRSTMTQLAAIREWQPGTRRTFIGNPAIIRASLSRNRKEAYHALSVRAEKIGPASDVRRISGQ